jgi:alpha-D-ribose 1-methylphosphonate 5-phosphate C-P lyase
LQLDRTGDLGEGNAGMLIFAAGRERPEYVPWTDVEQIDFDRPPVMYPPLGGR